MDADFDEMLKLSLERKRLKEEGIKEVSKNKLYQVSKKKILTTMIGALDAIEKNFGFLWGDPEDMTVQQKQMRLIYDQIRSEILDRGNTQIRNLEAEFSNYDIVFKKYNTVIPFKKG